jgi:hypothetical protein
MDLKFTFPDQRRDIFNVSVLEDLKWQEIKIEILVVGTIEKRTPGDASDRI